MLAQQFNTTVGQPDINDISFADNPNVGLRVFGILTPTSSEISDKLKSSNSHNGSIFADEVVGGKEDCADVNNESSNLFFSSKSWNSGGLYIFTVKGGSSNISYAGFIDIHGKIVDLDIDNYSDQKHRPSKNIDCTQLRTRDGSPIRWRSWMGCRPTFAPDQANECVFCLPAPVGFVVNRGYQLLKILKLAK